MENTQNIIEVKNVSMRFNLTEEKTDSIKEYLIKKLKGKIHYSEFYALKDVSFNIKRGEAVALIGRNGSGKSTMLKIIAGVMYPSAGSVSVRGSIAPLIELGAGFDMELTARENIYLNGAVMGHDRAFMDKYFNDIVEFSELHNFIDVPVKNFSSGMIARLGFAVATIVKADILVVDEILAVGDYNFQQKCKKRMEELMAGGTTLLFVSHSAEQVRELCSKAILFDHGQMMAYGKTEEIYRMYDAMLSGVPVIPEESCNTQNSVNAGEEVTPNSEEAIAAAACDSCDNETTAQQEPVVCSDAAAEEVHPAVISMEICDDSAKVKELSYKLLELSAKYDNLYAYSESRDQMLAEIQGSRSYRLTQKIKGSLLYRGTRKIVRKLYHILKALLTLNFKALVDEITGPFIRLHLRFKAPMLERKALLELSLALSGKDIIVFPPTIDWHMPLFQRPQQLAGAYSRKKGIAVIYITQNIKYDHVAVAEAINPNLWIVSESYAKRLPEITKQAKSVTLSISWTLNQHYLDIVKPDKLIYEYIDELEIFGGYGPQMELDHLRFLKEADVTVCTATKLYNQAAHLAKNPIVSPNAGDYEFFAKTDSYEINPLIRDIIKPYHCVIGYYGALAAWFDYELVKSVAKLHPDWLFLLVGVDYDGTIRKSGVLEYKNIVYIPPQPYTELPSFLKAFDVASIPFVINEITLSTSPVKLFEYMAGGKPIIASKMPECLKYESVKTYSTINEFCQIIETYLAMKRDDEYWNVLKKDALDNTWDARTDEIIAALS